MTTGPKRSKSPPSKGTWGGRREGAGRPRVAGSGVSHHSRARFRRRTPVHVVVRVLREVGPLRRASVAEVLRDACAGADGKGFRITRSWTQGNAIHLVCEATGTEQLSRGMQGWSIRFARQLNRRLDRSGKVLADRYEAELLTTPEQLRALVAAQDAAHAGT